VAVLGLARVDAMGIDERAGLPTMLQAPRPLD
jgi:hypothetical protein